MCDPPALTVPVEVTAVGLKSGVCDSSPARAAVMQRPSAMASRTCFFMKDFRGADVWVPAVDTTKLRAGAPAALLRRDQQPEHGGELGHEPGILPLQKARANAGFQFANSAGNGCGAGARQEHDLRFRKGREAKGGTPVRSPSRGKPPHRRNSDAGAGCGQQHRATSGTNSKTETTRFVRAAFEGMQELLGPLHEESYVLVHATDGDAYGYGGRTQNGRWAAAHPGLSNMVLDSACSGSTQALPRQRYS